MKKPIISIIAFLFPLILVAQGLYLDRALGEANAKTVETQMGIYDDEDKTEYLRRVGNRLVSQLEDPLFEYQFHLIPDMSPNAFALPGGYIYVTTGLLPILESEDELACILGHEIIHSNNRHTIQQLKKSILPRLLEVPGNLLGVIDEDLGNLFNAPIQISNTLLFASYGRKFESEADEIGIQLAAKAGYNPYAMITSLSRMSKAIEVATGNEEKKSYFNDHPYTPDRVMAIQQEISEIKWQQKDPVSKNFLYEFDGTLFGDSPAKGVINKNQFLHPDLNFSIEFPKGWNIDNQPTNVSAYHPDRKAAAFVSIEILGLSPEEAGKKFMKELDKEYTSKMTENGPYKFNNKDGYLISFVEETKTEKMYAYVLWLPLEDKLFKLMGIAPIEYKPKLEKIAASLRVLTKKEKNSFTINLMKIVEAQKGETLATLSERVDNKLNLNLTSVINSKEVDEKLKKGTLIKIVLEKTYN